MIRHRIEEFDNVFALSGREPRIAPSEGPTVTVDFKAVGKETIFAAASGDVGNAGATRDPRSLAADLTRRRMVSAPVRQKNESRARSDRTTVISASEARLVIASEAWRSRAGAASLTSAWIVAPSPSNVGRPAGRPTTRQ
jgi:hypothetical protein